MSLECSLGREPKGQSKYREFTKEECDMLNGFYDEKFPNQCFRKTKQESVWVDPLTMLTYQYGYCAGTTPVPFVDRNPKYYQACSVGKEPDPNETNAQLKDVRTYTETECVDKLGGWFEPPINRCWRRLEGGSSEILGRKCRKVDPEIAKLMEAVNEGQVILNASTKEDVQTSNEVMKAIFKTEGKVLPEEWLFPEPPSFASKTFTKVLSALGLEENDETYLLLALGGGLGAVLLYRYMRSRVVNPPVSK